MFDHYMQYAPLVYGNIFTTYSIKDAAAYRRALKLNTEPLRSWVFAQGVARAWNNQPPDWGIEVRFWSHVLYGSKGILFFSSMDDSAGQTISFNVPDWISMDRIQKLAENGLTDVTAGIDGRTVTLSNLDLNSAEPYQVFLIGAEDTTAPDSPTGLNVARILDANNHVLRPE